VLTDVHVVFLPPRYAAAVSSSRGAVLLYGEIPNAASLDSGLAKNPPGFRAVDWTREPVLDSEHDARKRIYLVTPKLFGTKAVKGEMIIYPHVMPVPQSLLTRGRCQITFISHITGWC
jgi:hypothetical protein